MTTQTLNPRHARFVAAYLGEANGNATEAARLAGYAKPMQQGSRLLRNVEVAAAIEAHNAQVKARGIAVKQNRLDSYVRDFDGTEAIIRARAEHYAGKCPGGDTGLIVGQLKLVKHVDDTDPETGQRIWFEETWEYVLDAGLLAERRHLRKQIAQELGEWTERRDVTGKVGIDLNMADSALERLSERIAKIAERALGGTVRDTLRSEPQGSIIS
jgi:hypothetical protein